MLVASSGCARMSFRALGGWVGGMLCWQTWMCLRESICILVFVCLCVCSVHLHLYLMTASALAGVCLACVGKHGERVSVYLWMFAPRRCGCGSVSVPCAFWTYVLSGHAVLWPRLHLLLSGCAFLDWGGERYSLLSWILQGVDPDICRRRFASATRPFLSERILSPRVSLPRCIYLFPHPQGHI